MSEVDSSQMDNLRRPDKCDSICSSCYPAAG